MRPAARMLPVLFAALALSCGGETQGLTAPPPTELSIAVMLNPDATGGMRPSTIVSAQLFENDVVTGVLQSAEFTVFDARGVELASGSVTGPMGFGPDRMMTIRQALDWTPAEVLGRSLRMTFTLVRPEPLVIQQTVTF